MQSVHILCLAILSVMYLIKKRKRERNVNGNQNAQSDVFRFVFSVTGYQKHWTKEKECYVSFALDTVAFVWPLFVSLFLLRYSIRNINITELTHIWRHTAFEMPLQFPCNNILCEHTVRHTIIDVARFIGSLYVFAPCAARSFVSVISTSSLDHLWLCHDRYFGSLDTK